MLVAKSLIDLIRSFTGPPPEGYIPPDYQRVRKTPPPLPQSWIDMNFKGKNMTSVLNYIDQVNQRIIKDTLNNVELKVIPLFRDIVNVARPYVGLIDEKLTDVILQKLDDLSNSDVVNAVKGLF